MGNGRPCTNCRRIHWGHCYNHARTCWTCGGSGHIQRYCPSMKRHKAPQGDPLPGTSTWFEALGLDNDLLLKSNIMSTLKEYPGATIFLNDECIYRGVQTYFYRKALPQGPGLAERLRRPACDGRRGRRSRSPSRERVLKRSRSPLGIYSRGKSPERVEDGQYDVGRLLFPADNLYERRSLSPIIDLTNVELVSPPRSSRAENIPPVKASYTAVGKRPLIPVPRAMPSRGLSSSRRVLGLRSGNVPLSSLLDAPIIEDVPLGASRALIQMEDPHFVLGISKGAREDECVDFPITTGRS